ncbi:PP2C family protein-serine/threonine phosphatase [Streptomyces profundus]|uniref:PP2C family protein-serine/threonine phosphatase n=1 Tax=Streptomyces profundus TaxID=2867410 RepID=UPI001D1622D7|nr:SpoIIE family protein phosphatase [Streptomyces sp. MA3_2.13]UED86776.1 SpoIIE family protein phosphatase [Streptomyces sp. MA3_2.13]
MTESEIDYAAVYQAYPAAVALLSPDLMYVDANDAYLKVAGRPREQVVGHYVFEAFPDNPEDARASGMRNLKLSLERVAATGERDAMAIQRYDVQFEDRPGTWSERYWSIVNMPVPGPDGSVALLLHRVEEVTELIRARYDTGLGPEAEDRATRLESDLFTRAKEVQDANETLRRAHAREKEVALTLQKAMLVVPEPAFSDRVAVRYRPASATMNVCGDWYDMITVDEDRISVAVGDVVGHGLEAAGVMGQLRSALSAVARVSQGPGRALEVLDLYSRSVRGAESTTVVKTFIARRSRTVVYSSAGHLPPALVRVGGVVEFLDRATAPPLGARPEPGPAEEASVHFGEGDTLVLYTDGLVERRGEDIDLGLARLADSLTRHHTLSPEALADALLADLLSHGGTEDDTALVIVRL